ncbi:MAG: TetR family transcriptional regulator [Clostridiales bacterium]|jgi:AcrR family transcriptional regulator|nr:TetR family transcriptional regulator [Clostridiales bacterium]
MDNKENIINCAIDLFYSKGYNSVGIQELVDKAGITKPTLYYYYGSKLGLLESILELHFNKWLDDLTTAAEYNHDLPLTLEKVAAAYLNFAVMDNKFYYIMLALIFSAKDNEAYKAVIPYLIKQNNIFIEIFEKARTELGNMNGREKQFARSFHGILSEYAVFYLEESEIDNRVPIDQRTIYLLVHQFMHGIYS